MHIQETPPAHRKAEPPAGKVDAIVREIEQASVFKGAIGGLVHVVVPVFVMLGHWRLEVKGQESVTLPNKKALLPLSFPELVSQADSIGSHL